MKFVSFVLTLLLAASVLAPSARAADAVSVRAILITATNEKREADPKLRPYEAELQRNLPLSSFRYVGEGAASIAAKGQASITLARGHRVSLSSEGGLRLKVVWTAGGALVIDSTISFNPGVPVVLVHRAGDDNKESPIILVIAK